MLWKSSSTRVSGAPNDAMPFISSITALSTGFPGDLQPPQRTAAKAAAHAFDRHGRVGPEPHRIVVAGLERHPGDRSRSALVPRASGHGLSVSRGSRDERERHVVSFQDLLHARARDHLGAQPRQEQLRLGNRKRLGLDGDRHRRLVQPGSRDVDLVQGVRPLPAAVRGTSRTKPILCNRETIATSRPFEVCRQ